jgi:hypothetical protein
LQFAFLAVGFFAFARIGWNGGGKTAKSFIVRIAKYLIMAVALVKLLSLSCPEL